MDKTQKAKAAEAIGLMLAGFPSSQLGMTEETSESYLLAVSNCTLAAVEATCTAFLRGQVTGHNNDYPPSAPKLAALALELGNAAQSLADAGERKRIISYPIGSEPPKGYEPIGPKDDKWRGPSHTKMISHK